MIDKQQEPMYAEAQAVVKQYRPIEALIPAHWSEGDVSTNGVRLHYYRTGDDKPALLLLHGFEEYGLTWLHTAKELEPDYDLIMVDARGHGHSDGIANAGYPPQVNVEDIVGFIHALALGRPKIIGFSMGGTTALNLAATHPELVHSFIFEGWADGARQTADMANSEGYQNWFKNWLAGLQRLRTINREERLLSALPQLLSMMGGRVWPEDEYVPMAEANALFDLDLATYGIKLWSPEYQGKPDETLQQVTCPALIMKHSFAFPAPGAQPAVREVVSQRPNVRIVYFDNVGHMIHRAAFEQYIALVREFLAAH